MTVLLAATLALPAHAQEAGNRQPPTEDTGAQLGQPAQAQTSESQRRIRFDIPAQPLSSALEAFGERTGLQIKADTDTTAGVQAQAVSGEYTPREALERLLAGSGLSYHFIGAQTVRLVVAPPTGVTRLAPIIVEAERSESAYGGPATGYVAERSATATKTDTPISEVPQSISVITRDQMVTRGARSVTEALRYSAGVTAGQRGGVTGLADNNIVIRGFGGAGSTNEYWDGLRLEGTDFATGGIDPFLFQRIEVLRGPASVLYGQNQPGGIVNYVSRRPTFKPQGVIQILGGSFDTKEIDANFSGPLTSELAYRVTGVYSDREGQTDFTGRERTVLSPSITWEPTTDTTFTLQSVYQKDDADGGIVRFIPADGSVFGASNGKIPRERFTGDPNYDIWNREILSGAYFLEHRFNDSWSVRQRFRYLNTELFTEMVYATSLLDDNRTVTRSAFGLKEESDHFALDNQLEGHVETGPLSHTLLLGLIAQKWESSSLRRFSRAPTLNLFDPVYHQNIPQPPIFQNNDIEQLRVGFYLQDQIKLDRWILTLGGRYDISKSETTNNLANETTDSDATALTTRLGLGYAFDSGITPYFSYAESFEPVIGTDFFGKSFDPTEGEQFEAGIKYAIPGYPAFITLSAFQLTQQNVLTSDSDPDHQGFSVQTGEVRSRGIELEGVASLGNWNAIASYNYLDQEVTESNDDNLGKRLPAIPRQKAALWIDYVFDQGWATGLQVGAGATYAGSSAGDSLNTFEVDSYILVDAALNYNLSALHNSLRGWKISVNATNLADNTYVASCTSAVGCYYGMGRSIIARLRWTLGPYAE